MAAYSFIWIIYIGIAVGLAFIPANMAKNKGYSFAGFWCLSFFLSFLVGIIVAACLPDKNEYVRKDEYYGQQYSGPDQNYTKYCPKCGCGLRIQDAYCPKCGNKIE